MDQTSHENFRADLYKAIWRDLDPLEKEIEDAGTPAASTGSTGG